MSAGAKHGRKERKFDWGTLTGNELHSCSHIQCVLYQWNLFLVIVRVWNLKCDMQLPFSCDNENRHSRRLRNCRRCRPTEINVSAVGLQPTLSGANNWRSRSPMDDSSTFTSEQKVAQCLKLLLTALWPGPPSDCEGPFQCPKNLRWMHYSMLVDLRLALDIRLKMLHQNLIDCCFI